MVSARAKHILRQIYKVTKPGLKSYGKKLGTYVDAEVARRTAGTSFAGLVPEVSTFYPAEGSGLSLAGRGYHKRSKIKRKPHKNLKLQAGYSSHLHNGKRYFSKLVPVGQVVLANRRRALTNKRKSSRKTYVTTQRGARSLLKRGKAVKVRSGPLTQAEALALLASGKAIA